MKHPMPFLMLCLTLLGVACNEFISPEISDWKARLQFPGDSLFLSDNSLLFRWEAEERVSQYHFQLARPDFEQASYWVDTLLTDPRILLTLPEGHFQWRVRGKNEASSSAFSTRHFTLDHSPPALPWATYPAERDTLKAGRDLLELRWQSQDAISRVWDSVYLYSWYQGIPLNRQGFLFEVGKKKKLELQPWLGESGTAPREYRWEIKSFDEAGNSSCSRLFSFWVL